MSIKTRRHERMPQYNRAPCSKAGPVQAALLLSCSCAAVASAYSRRAKAAKRRGHMYLFLALCLKRFFLLVQSLLFVEREQEGAEVRLTFVLFIFDCFRIRLCHFRLRVYAAMNGGSRRPLFVSFKISHQLFPSSLPFLFSKTIGRMVPMG